MEADRPPKVFISYSWDSAAHEEQVRALVDRLIAEGIDCVLDRYQHPPPPQGWPTWMREHVKDADFVLVVCSEGYNTKAEGKAKSGGAGVRFESVLVLQELYEHRMWNQRVLPVLVQPAGLELIWEPLRPYHHYRADTAEGYEDLYRRLTDQPALVRPKLGTRKVLPPRNLPAPLAQSAAAGPASATNPAPPAARAQAEPPQPIPGQPWTEPTTDIRFLWVPPGEFSMGSNEIGDHERPAHRVKLSGFWLAETPVTNRQYGLYLEAGQGKVEEPQYWRDRRFSNLEQPVVGVSWEEARAFCQWLAGLARQPVELPTEAQWEYATRGVEGRKYPWGNRPEPSPQLACYDQDWEKGSPAVVGSYPAGAGPFGHLDLAGNVWEWCLDVWNAAAYKGRKGVAENPVETRGGAEVRVLRGGGWRDSAVSLQSACRFWYPAWLRYVDFGFRVAVSPPSR